MSCIVQRNLIKRAMKAEILRTFTTCRFCGATIAKIVLFCLIIATKMENPVYSVDAKLNEKVSLWEGDITTLEIDAIVNAGEREYHSPQPLS